MKILLVYPKTPATFWSFHDAVKFISKKAGNTPLGLITVSAMLPHDWQKKLIDMNVSPLRDADIRWADYVFLSGMNIHRESFRNVVKRCNELEVPVVAGGPLVTTEYRDFQGIDHFILNEAELTLPPFLEDLKNGKPRAVYASSDFPDISKTPTPEWNLLEKKKYASVSIQYSRGCPYDCEFCSITMLNGHAPRTKETGQFLAELQALYDDDWRGDVFVVDDNFIGNKKKLKTDLLPGLIDWQKQHGNPFLFGTEVSINLGDDEELMNLMVTAGFNHTFVGIETPNGESLAECGKKQNLKRDMLDTVKQIHKSGLRVSGGFIIGFDSDPADIFDQQINFIRKSGIVTAMVGLLNAPTGSRLFQRLQKEDRLLNSFAGDNMDGTLNFVPRMRYQNLMAGYKKVLETIYSQKEYYERVKTFLREYQLPLRRSFKIKLQDLKALFRSFWILGVLEKGKRYYWKLLFFSLFRYPRKFALAVTMAIYGFHFRQVVKTI